VFVGVIGIRMDDHLPSFQRVDLFTRSCQCVVTSNCTIVPTRSCRGVTGQTGSRTWTSIVGRTTLTLLVGDSAAMDPPDESPVVGAENIRPFVGRARELRELTWALEAARTGHGSLMLVSGEPGIGKSRLIEELAETGRARGCQVLIGRCWEGGGAPAYWPWVQVVRAAGGDFEDLALAATATPSSRGPTAEVDPDAALFRLFQQVARFLSQGMVAAPLLVVVEDLHAADEPSMLLLRFLATSVVEQPMLLVASYRDVEPRVHEAAELFGELSRLGRRLPLGGLDRTEIARYIEIVAGTEPAPVWVERVFELTAGNPFFVGEVVRAESEARTTDERHRLPEEVAR
jgi:predicted ATPase